MLLCLESCTKVQIKVGLLAAVMFRCWTPSFVLRWSPSDLWCPCSGGCHHHKMKRLFTAFPPHTSKQLLYFKIEYCLMITLPTHKCHKSPFKHSKTIYVLTFGRVIITFQIHSRKKLLKGLKWPLQNGPSLLETSRIWPILLQGLMKRGVCQCGVADALTYYCQIVFSLAELVIK